MALKDTWNVEQLVFGEDGLLPVIVQDYESGEVLMLACMNKEAAEKTIESGYAHYYDKATGIGNTIVAAVVLVNLASEACLLSDGGDRLPLVAANFQEHKATCP